MAPALKIISIVWRIIEPSMIFLSKREQSMLYFTPIACTINAYPTLWHGLLPTSSSWINLRLRYCTLRHNLGIPLLCLYSLNVAGVDIIPSNIVRNLGVRLDNKLNMKQHINNTCRAAAFGISKIGKLRKYLNKQSTERLIHAFVTSHLDYCNGLYVGLPNSTFPPTHSEYSGPSCN